MTSLQRIRLALRATIAETPRVTYFITSLLLLALLGFVAYFRHQTGSVNLLVMAPNQLVVLFTIIAFIPAFAIAAGFIGKRLKKTERAEAFLSLPLSNGERFTLTLLQQWVFVPLITYGPLLVLGLLTYVVRPNWLVMPDLGYLLAAFPLAVMLYWAASVFWIFPTIAFPRFLIVVLLLLIGVSVGSAYLAVEVLPAAVHRYPVESDVFTDPNVVGMAAFGVHFGDELPTQFYFNERIGSFAQLLPFLLAAPLLLFAAYRALTLKQA